MPERPSDADFARVSPENTERPESGKKHPVTLETRLPEDNGTHQHIILFRCESGRDRAAYDRAVEAVLDEEIASRQKKIANLRGTVDRLELRKIPGVSFIFHQINTFDNSGWEVQGPGITAEYINGLFERIHKKAEEYR